MKTKAKLTLAISVMSAAVLAAGVTSTFAWFTTNSSATANFATLNVESPSTIKISGYQVTHRGSDNNVSVAAMTQTNTNVVTGTDVAIGAVSSKDGVNFYAPTSVLADDDGTALEFDSWADVSGANNKYKGFVKYNLSVLLEKAESAKNVNVSVKEGTGNGEHVVDWYRVAVYETEATNLNVTTTLAKKASGFEKVFGHSGVTGTDSYINSAGTAGEDGVIKSDRTVVAQNTATAVTGFASSTSANVTKNFVVAVFLEGTAAARQNDAGGEALNLSLKFEFAA